MSFDLTKKLLRYRASSIMNNSAEFATKVTIFAINTITLL